jgi:hypothetical protein
MHLWITLQPTFGTNFLKENWCFLNDNQQVWSGTIVLFY